MRLHPLRARAKGNNEETTHNTKANTTDKSARETRERESLDDGERDMREVSEMETKCTGQTDVD